MRATSALSKCASEMFGAEHIVGGKLTRPGAPLTETTACLRAPHARQNTLQRCWQSGSRFGLRCSDPARSDCSPGYMPIFPVRMSGPSSCEWDGTGASTWSVAMEAHPERASITKSVASDFRQFIAYSGPPDPPYLTRANDRLDRAGVIVLDVADPRDNRSACHPGPYMR